MAPPELHVLDDPAAFVRRVFSRVFEVFDTASALEAAHSYFDSEYAGRHDGKELSLREFLEALYTSLRRLSAPARIVWKSLVATPADSNGRVRVTSVHDTHLTHTASEVLQSVMSLIEIDVATSRIVACEELTRIISVNPGDSAKSTPKPRLTLGDLEDLRTAVFADDLPIEPAMASWSEMEVASHFESPPPQLLPPQPQPSKRTAASVASHSVVPLLHPQLSQTCLERQMLPGPGQAPSGAGASTSANVSARCASMSRALVEKSPPQQLAGLSFRRCRSSPASGGLWCSKRALVGLALDLEGIAPLPSLVK
jgi:hypothetical protein